MRFMTGHSRRSLKKGRAERGQLRQPLSPANVSAFTRG